MLSLNSLVRLQHKAEKLQQGGRDTVLKNTWKKLKAEGHLSETAVVDFLTALRLAPAVVYGGLAYAFLRSDFVLWPQGRVRTILRNSRNRRLSCLLICRSGMALGYRKPLGCCIFCGFTHSGRS